MARYYLKIPDDVHWAGMWAEIGKIDKKLKHPYDIDGFLKQYKGKTFNDPGFDHIKIIQGIDFETEENLLYFKLKFN
jgi:hypothetical protein